MEKIDERLCNIVSTAELERRWALVRRRMEDEKIDVLVAHGTNGYGGGPGHFRWLTGIPVMNSYAQAVIFPRDGLATVIHHGDFGGHRENDPSTPEFRGIGERFMTPSFPAISYAAGYEADIAAKVIRERGYAKVGMVAPFSVYHGFVSRLHTLLGGVKMVDFTDAIDEFKAIKSEEDIAWIRQSARMQDEILAEIATFVKPGMKDFEVMAYAQYLGQLRGSEGGYMIGTSAPMGQPAMIRHRPFQGRTIQHGDVLMFQCENSGPGGFFVHLGRMLVLGKAPQEMKDAFEEVVEAQKYTLGLLQPGASSKDVFRQFNAYLKSRKLPEERRLHCHGQGYEVVERPLVRDDESMHLAAGMNIGIHPAIVNAHMFVTVCDNFLLTDGAPERLHATPQKIFEI
jgi:Xaa-Pro aminopeptidase